MLTDQLQTADLKVVEYQRELTALKQKIADLSKETEEVKNKHMRVREKLKN